MIANHPSRRWIMVVLQSLTLVSALVLAWLLRFDFTLPRVSLLMMAAPLLLAIRWLAMSAYKVAHSYWRFTSIGDLNDLLKAIISGSLGFFLLMRCILGIRAFPYSIYVLEAILAFLLLSGIRVGARLLLQAQVSRPKAQVRVLVVGAGAAAALLLKELERMNYTALGMVDDDPAKLNTKVSGVPVLGSVNQMAILTHRHRVEEILIAIPSATCEQMLHITDSCVRSGLPFRAVPGLADLIEGRVSISELRPVDLDSLLGREPVRFESEGVREHLRGRVVMVTGAAGSIGSELCRQIARFPIRKLICVDQAETPLFNLQQYTLAGSEIETAYSVTDITDVERMRHLMLDHQVGIIFHAAAYKHVPMTEANPYEGVKNNVFGLLALVEAAEDCGCEDFLLISTDKAVKPTSLMGCTKRLGEMIVSARRSPSMRCVSVRFGNVLGSQGSVVPVFQEQIRTTGQVTVTDPEMTRYFMTIPEAVSLVLLAFTVGEDGNIMVLDMGKPVRILDLANTLIRLSGRRDVRIVYTGMRPGEKQFEELFYDFEVQLPTAVPRVARAKSQMPDWRSIRHLLEELRTVAHQRDIEKMRIKIKQLIPESQWAPQVLDHASDVSLALPLRPSPHAGLQAQSTVA